MLALGALSIVVGAILIVSGLATETSVRTEAQLPSSPYLPYVPAADVVNIGLLQKQMILIHLGIGAVIVGAVFLGFGLVLERFARPSQEAVVEGVPVAPAPPPAAPRPAEETPAAEPDAGDDAEMRNMLLIVFGGLALLIAIALFVGWTYPSSPRPGSSDVENEANAAMSESQNALDAINAAEAELRNAAR